MLSCILVTRTSSVCVVKPVDMTGKFRACDRDAGGALMVFLAGYAFRRLFSLKCCSEYGTL